MWGAWVGLMSKIFLGKKWILRCGFEHHRFLRIRKATRREKAFSYGLSWVAYRVADVVVWSTEAERVWAMRHFGLRAANHRLRIVPNYVDTDLFTTQALDLKSRRLLTVARLDPQKNLDSLIRALAGKKLELDIVGDGPLYDRLPELEFPTSSYQITPSRSSPSACARWSATCVCRDVVQMATFQLTRRLVDAGVIDQDRHGSELTLDRCARLS